MGSAVLFILRPRLLLYSAGSGINRVQVVLSGFSVRLFCPDKKLYVGMVACISHQVLHQVPRQAPHKIPNQIPGSGRSFTTYPGHEFTDNFRHKIFIHFIFQVHVNTTVLYCINTRNLINSGK